MDSSVDINVWLARTSHTRVDAPEWRARLDRAFLPRIRVITPARRIAVAGVPLAPDHRNVTAMLSRILACVLIVLVVAPFTAPFPTCDLIALVGGSHPVRTAPATAAPVRGRRGASRRMHGGGDTTTRTAFAAVVAGRGGPTPYPPRSRARTDDVAVPGTFVTSTLVRSRLPHLGRAANLSTVTAGPTSTAPGADRRSTTQASSTRQFTILRV